MWPDDAFSLPARDGYDVGGAQERAMSARVDGYGGIRETYDVNPDGSVTTLRTRMGWPAFETTGQPTAAAPTVPERGFVAKVPGGRAVLFNPYTLAVLKSPYLPASNSYSVQDFGTTWNVAPADTTHWYDVVLFDGTTIKVNSKAMPSLRITANHGFPAIPYVINRDTSDDQYGNAERNTTDKRVFAVGRHSVKSWGGSGVVETLMPEDPRTESRCLTIGQRTDRETNTAWLGQLFFTGSSWDSISGEWEFSAAQIQMLLTGIFLVKVSSTASVAMTPAGFTTTTPFSQDGWENVTYPSTPIMLRSSGEVWQPANFPTSSVALTAWPWSGQVSLPLEGDVYVNRNGETKSGEQDATVTAAGVIINYHSDNAKRWTSGYDKNYIKEQTISIAPDAVINEGGSLFGTLSHVYWYAGDTVPGDSHGKKTFYNGSHTQLSAGLIYKSWGEQTGSGYASIGADRLVDVSFSKTQTSGNTLVISPNTTRYDYLFENPYLTLGQSYTFGLTAVEEVYIDYSASNYKNPTGHYQDPSAIVEINDTVNARAALLAARMCYIQDDNAYLAARPWYNTSIVTTPVVNSMLNWTTKDYILYDAINGVYVSVECVFVGINTTATLTVLLRVKTRHHDITQTLGSFSYTYSDMLPDSLDIGGGKYAIPSPQIRAIFAPLYQEQGSFNGAHYVTIAEESNGATAFHGFNFLLYLRPYGNFDTCNEDNDGQAVYFVPCNLLEMLYAFVFSSDLGVAEDGTRYPVTHSANFTALMNTLFSNPIRVAVKDGVAGAWTDALGSDFASVSTVSLHRA